MSDNIPFDLQVEIIKRVFPVKSVIRFRSVSKQWKSLIDSPDFINNYRVNQHHLLITYKAYSEDKYVSIIDDDTFPLHKSSPVVPPTLKPAASGSLLGSSHGVVCFYDFSLDLSKNLIVLWNPSVRKSVGVMLPYYFTLVGFGVCPKTTQLKVVMITSDFEAEVFTLTSRTWRRIPMSLPLRHKLCLSAHNQVVIDGVINWMDLELLSIDDDDERYLPWIVSFDLTSEEFREIALPDSFMDDSVCPLISKFKESLAVIDYHEGGADIWVLLENGVSFTKLFTVKIESSSTFYNIIGFRKNGQPVMEPTNSHPEKELEVYEPAGSKYMNGVGIYGWFFHMASYTESLLLLNHPESIIE